jgi:voltage-dependent calcium channel L type alpha-1D
MSTEEENDFRVVELPVLPGLEGLDTNPPAKKIVGPSGKEYHGHSLCCLRISTQPRKWCIQTIESRWFDPIILITILANCTTMAWQSPLDPAGTDKAALIDVMEWCYLYIFTFELVSKIISYSFLFQEGAYLRDPWCQLDFVVVSLAWLPIFFPSMGNYSIFRAVRALRPLRALKRVPGMPQMIAALMSAFPKLANVLALCAFIFLVFGIVGMELFKGALHYRCAEEGFVETFGHPARRLDEFTPLTLGLLTLSAREAHDGALAGSGAAGSNATLVAAAGTAAAYALTNASDGLAVTSWEDWMGWMGPWPVGERRKLKGGGASGGGSSDTHDQSEWDSEKACKPEPPEERRRRLKGGGANAAGDGGGEQEELGHWAGECQASQTCSYFDTNANFGLMGFDNIWMAFLLILQCTTFDTWTDAMYALMNSFSTGVCLYFILASMLCGIFVVQLFLAVIFDEFLKAQELDRVKEEMLRKQAEGQARLRAKRLAAEAAAAGLSPPPSPPAPLDVESNALLDKGMEMSDEVEVVEPRGCCDCTPEPNTWRAALGKVAVSDTLGNISTGLVLYNLYLMCCPYWGMSAEYEADLEEKSTYVSLLFIFEMILKLFGLGCSGYWSDGWNQLDGTIVSLSILEMSITILLADTGVNLSFLRILRMLRILRILRLMKSWKGLYKIIVCFGKAAPQMGNIFVLMFLGLLIFALLGMQLFAGIYNADTGYCSMEDVIGGQCDDASLEPQPRFHFDYFFPSMLTCFVMMTGGWVDPAGTAYKIAGPTAVVYMVSVVLVGLMVILNLFIAILLNAFAEPEEEAVTEEKDEVALEVKGAPYAATAIVGSSPEPVMKTTARDVIAFAEDGSGADDRSNRALRTRAAIERAEYVMAQSEREALANEYSSDYVKPELPRVRWPHDYSMLLFSPSNGLRRSCHKLLADPLFDQVITTAIIVSSICLALDVPRLDQDGALAHTLHFLDYVWLALFFSEMMTKIIAFGFMCTEDSYVSSPWNLLDLVIVTVSILVALAEFFPMFAGLKMLRILRVLRPLRLLARNPGMKLVIVSLFKSMPAVGNVFGVVLALQLVFAILGMQIFMGQLSSCTDASILYEADCHPPPPVAEDAVARRLSPQLLSSPMAPGGASSLEAMSVPAAAAFSAAAASVHQAIAPWWTHGARGYSLSSERRRRLKGGGSEGSGSSVVAWVNPPLGSFDSFGSAMLLLFIMSTGDGWDALMFSLMDSSPPGEAPIRNDFSVKALFAIAWMFVGSFFAINLFVGVVVDNFNRLKQEAEEEGGEGGSATMTPEQAQWVETMKGKTNQKPAPAPIPPENCVRRFFYRIVTSSAFDSFIIGVIIANVGMMAYDYWGIEQNEEDFTFYSTSMMYFSYIYYTEFTFKIIGLGPYTYFGDNWCRFDFTLVCTSLLDQFAAELLEQFLPIPPMVLRVLRVLRILRILRLLKGPGARQVRDLIMTLVLSFPSLINVGGVLGLVVFMYAVLGVNLFTYVAKQDNLTENRNFMTLSSSMLLLFQCLTGDNWSGMMIDSMVSAGTGKCSDEEGNCGMPLGGLLFFVSFMLIAAFVVLNLVVAVILENFSSLGNMRPDLVSKDDIETFKEAWAEFDPDSTLKVPAKVLPDLVLSIPPPMGIKGVPGGRMAARRICLGLETRTTVAGTAVTKKLKQDANGDVAFNDVLDALVLASYKSKEVEIDSVMGSSEEGEGELHVSAGNDVAMQFALEAIGDRIHNMLARARARIEARGGKKAKKGSGKKAGGGPGIHPKRSPPGKPPPGGAMAAVVTAAVKASKARNATPPASGLPDVVVDVDVPAEAESANGGVFAAFGDFFSSRFKSTPRSARSAQQPAPETTLFQPADATTWNPSAGVAPTQVWNPPPPPGAGGGRGAGGRGQGQQGAGRGRGRGGLASGLTREQMLQPRRV